MANITTRRGEPHGGLAGFVDPARGFDPFRLMRDILSGDPFAGSVAAMSESFAPDVEIKETKDSYDLCMDLPGVREQDIDVSITGNRLTVSGRRAQEEQREDERFFLYERAYGAFSRAFTIPDGADLEKVKADLRDGVLRLTIPKRAEMQSRRVEIGGVPAGAKEMPSQAGKEAATGQPPQKKAA